MVEVAVVAPRRFGVAPSTDAIFKNDDDRIARRKKDFDKMDVNKSGTITFDEWLHYAHEHIVKKCASL